MKPTERHLIGALLGPRWNAEALGSGVNRAERYIVRLPNGEVWFVKVGTADDVSRDAKGDALIRGRITEAALPPRPRFISRNGNAAIAYRFIEGAPNMLRWVNEGADSTALLVAVRALVEALRTLHLPCAMGRRWTKRRLDPAPDLRDSRTWEWLVKAYEEAAAVADGRDLPFALTHGDLTTANILVPDPQRPILIDFTTVGERPVYEDYGKLEATLRLIAGREHIEVLAEGRRAVERKARVGSDDLYRPFLLFHLARYWSRPRNPAEYRERALQACREVAR